NANSGAGQVFQRFDAVLLAGHEALAVVKRRRHEVGGPVGFAGQSGGRVANEDVHFAGLDSRLTSGGRKGNELDGVGIAQHGGGDGAAEVDVKPGPVAAGVHVSEAEQSVVGPADEATALAHPLQRLRAADGRHDYKEDQNEQYQYSEPFSHSNTPRKSICYSDAIAFLCTLQISSVFLSVWRT